MPYPDAKLLDTTEVIRCWLVWQRAEDGGRPYLVSIDTTEDVAVLHAKSISMEAVQQGRTTMVQVEESLINHRYGESMGQGFDDLRKVVQEMKRDRTGD